MLTPALPARLRSLARELEDALEALPGVVRVWMWGQRNFKIGKKLFICYAPTKEGLSLGFKLPLEDARAARKAGLATKADWGSLGANGWVNVNLKTKRNLSRVIVLARRSHQTILGGAKK